jgi:aryl-alcohol dehydrogenase-like predicted oxidoreductase
MMFGDRTDESASLDIIDCAIDSEINFLDTAQDRFSCFLVGWT